MCGATNPDVAGTHEQARWQDLARTAGGWLFETDATLRFRWVSGAFAPFTVDRPEEVIGQRVLDVPLLDQQGQVRTDGLTLRTRLADAAPLVNLLTAWDLPAGRRIVAINAVPHFDTVGRIAGWRGNARDVTDLLAAQAQARARRALSFEERLAEAAAQSGIGFAELALPGGQMAFDAVACANHGLPFPHPPYHLGDWIAAVHPEDRPRAEAALHEAVERSGRMETRFRFIRPDGQMPRLDISARVRRDEQGRATMLTGTCRDVSAQVHAEQLLHEKEAAERASRAKTEIVARVSHELRTPLNAILGLAQLMALDDTTLPLAQRTRLAGINEAGRRLLGLVNDMLDLSQLEQGGLRLTPEAVDLAAAWQRCCSLVQPLADQRGVTLQPWSVTAGAVRAWADPRGLEQVLINLLSNAIKYNREGGKVWAEWVDDAATTSPPPRVRLGVCDDGPGLGPTQQAQLFQPFNRLGAEHRRIEGSGLGLVIARKLAESMRGELGVDSTPGDGSRFWLALPVVP